MKWFLFFAPLLFMPLSCGKGGKPVVGISCNHKESGGDYLSENYSKAILRAGGIPFIIPTVSSEQEAADILAKLDGVVFSGGSDIPPSWYGEELLNETVKLNPIRDRSDSLLAKATLASGKPILGICRGSQILNVLLGGTLYQDIPSQLPEAHTHKGVSHKIGLEKGSFLKEIFGTDSLTVNSTHHQAVKDLAPGAKLAALSDDGIVEAWETPQVRAVQFHPESLLAEDDKWLPLFESFVADAFARNRRSTHSTRNCGKRRIQSAPLVCPIDR